MEIKFGNQLNKIRFMKAIKEIVEKQEGHKYSRREYQKFINSLDTFKLNDYEHKSALITDILKENSYIYGYLFCDDLNQKMFIQTNISGNEQIENYIGSWNDDSLIDFKKYDKCISQNVDVYVSNMVS